MDRGKTSSIFRLREEMTASIDLGYPLKSVRSQERSLERESVREGFPQLIQLLPLHPLLPVGFAPRNASLRSSFAIAQLSSAPPRPQGKNALCLSRGSICCHGRWEI
jgi:hypothetical protein